MLLIFILFVNCLGSTDLPTNYEYYTSSGIVSGISTNETHFFLNEKPIFIYSGSVHYFRNPRAYWKTRLAQVRSAGLNTVETYIPWNLHEYQNGSYDFGGGGSEMQDFLYIEEFLQLAQSEDLFVILRPGPFISAEYNFAAFPSWLLREKPMGFRTDEANYIKYVSRYYNVLLPILAKYQFTKGGPIIAFQIENEYGYTGYQNFAPSRNYLEILRQLYLDNGIVELLVTSDNPIGRGDSGTLPGVLLQTANFGDSPEPYFNKLKQLQPDKPLMVMEFWIGWYDYWTNKHQTRTPEYVKSVYEAIVKYPASVNIYMFHGGCNFGFGNGAILSNELLDNSGFLPMTTSYDYDAPLDEAGDYRQKFFDVRNILSVYNPIKTRLPTPPEILARIAYQNIAINRQIKLGDVIANEPPMVLESENVTAMEMLDINSNSGQSYGYIVYRKENIDLEAGTVLKIGGHVCDTVVVLVNGVLVSPALESSADLDGFGYWRLENSTLIINREAIQDATVDIIVEEWGRMNGGTIFQYNRTLKGLWQGDVYFNDKQVLNWKIVPLEFKKQWNDNLSSWKSVDSKVGPALYGATLSLGTDIRDTYIDMREWVKGLVIVNGFPVRKYFMLGPQQTLYLPAPFLHEGDNHIVVFEHFKASDKLVFSDKQIYSNQ
ncbi:beta-galactosidase-1-like protein 3 [Diorhabda carinulata]|uniref:beta-galactosidase-1-like protein 3 n=1 Tax=Diorhabda carinulata TaxID=1163345 RepID=UPI0025A24C3F|nr:beta-galactosidase-1-like protein 3 [Diorhabda carinulata]